MASLKFHPGAHRDEPDRRDKHFRPAPARVPRSADLSHFCGKAYQQFHTLSCSANALAGAMTLLANQRDVDLDPPSRLFLYYNARSFAHQTGEDAGATIRNAIKALARYGTVPERLWPFLKADITVKPPRACYTKARVLPLRYARIAQRVMHMRASIAQGNPFLFGIQAYVQPFTEAATSGKLRLPRRSDTLCGGHALFAVGYDASRKAFLARNSLGSGFARDGFFWIPDAYFTDPELTYDYWSLGGSSGW
jgi:C1A family cysteine protease